MAFNWDNIDCASPNLENSAYFFSVRHVEHEKNYVEKMGKENSQNISENIKDVARIVAKELAAKKDKKEKVPSKTPSRIPLRTQMNVKEAAPKNFHKIVTRKTMILEKPVALPVRPPSRIPQRNVPKKPSIREEKKIPMKENAVKFKAKPAPNFKIIHEQQKKTVKVPPVVTIPQTPTVLRKSLAQKAQPRKRTVENIQPKKKPLIVQNPKPLVKAPIVQKREPFKPKKEVKTTTVVPFNLQTTRRFEERRRFDDLMRQMRDLKVQKEIAMKRQQEDNLRKEVRKRTEFRARPNPFK
ncbi:hypothetical protein DMENIID0001_066950 [Sergentomyia squamirostris]